MLKLISSKGLLLIVAVCLLTTSLSSCVYFLHTNKRLTILNYPYQANQPSKKLIVLLPGIRGRAATFEQQGVIKRMRKAGIDADIIAVDATFPYYKRRIIIERLRNEVIEPYIENKNYEEIWFVGVSLGGLGSILYSMAEPQSVTGIVLIAPFLGDHAIANEIKSQGGLASWRPGKIKRNDYQRLLWSWLQEYTAADNQLPKLYLAYGREDKYSSSHALLAQVLGEENKYIISGKHEWGVWNKLLDQILEEQILN